MPQTSIHEASPADYFAIAAFYERCGYSGGLEPNDTVLTAVRNGALVGAVRLTSEQQELVLRGMQVLPEAQRQGIGTDLLEACLDRVSTSGCYCIPWAYLEAFYASRGFKRCKSADVPTTLSKRFTDYLAAGRDVILMCREPVD